MNKTYLILGSVLFGGGIGILFPYNKPIIGIFFLVIGFLLQMYGIRDDKKDFGDEVQND